MKVEVIAKGTGLSLTAEDDKDKVELQLLKREIEIGRRQIYSQLSNGDYNYQLLFNEKGGSG